jgi:hypothetical protein
MLDGLMFGCACITRVLVLLAYCSSLCKKNCLILCNHLNVCEVAYMSLNFIFMISLCTIGMLCFHLGNSL